MLPLESPHARLKLREFPNAGLVMEGQYTEIDFRKQFIRRFLTTLGYPPAFVMNEATHHIRYLGFETEPTGGRRLEYAITFPAKPSRRAVVEIPVEAFTGPERVTFQDAAIVGCERLRVELEHEQRSGRNHSLNVILTPDEVARYRPRRRVATRRA